ncbi:SusC/RagA family TonB-linked outer membrane protein [Mucilaginibacter phyllosphaerae]|uniref:SusC/RagA family TonB-linked outer membrane protein n=1 Tax=Mucilaginibacter phyllosphaerae TaxID=1812349 RepID=A0A4Y8AFQ5_9SPHI|nr:SusC/RagA family TonB-linked outer membrane protein [Mucilaginibacter phyllosphaerae]MBB3968782.1 TonB-linked SusC/RagA family outer membrane protein [Mucilaginibacter phyllosphaerae]TEW67583.1 SusC/RagA family TonB-linked outer membrane protein [Mucilaginibacter phyllosphaerae]GGH13910.1 SusC/RagA family TonB-linked outer membrane protein [Mucilaginibacter phyllosphaerae]
MKKNLLKIFIGIVMAFSGLHAQSQTRIITGTVIAQDDGLPIPGVSVGVKGTGIGTQTSADGKYSLSVPAGAGTLFFSFIGYTTTELAITSNVINVKLAISNRQLTEVVVTGSGVATSKARLGISVEAVSSKNLPQTPTASIDQALVGKIPGAQISSVDGTPGARANIVLRGINTIQRGTYPMILVDGVESGATDISLLDLSNVDRIEVVQGAASSTIYGAQGANGVIQVFTKKGQKGKPQINISSSVAANSIINSGNVHQAKFNSFKTDANGNFIDNSGNIIALDRDGIYPGVSWAFPSGNGNPTAMSNPLNIADKSYGTNLKYYDHIKQLFKTAYTTNNSVNISGATEKIDYNFGITNNHQQSTIRTNGYNDRTNLITNLGIELFKGFTLRSITQLIYTRNTLNRNLGIGNSGGIFNALNASPFYDFNQKLADGTYPFSLNSGTVSVNGNNPFYYTEYGHTRDNRIDILQNLQADYKINKFLELNAKYGLNYSNQEANYIYENQSANIASQDLNTFIGNFAGDNTGELNKNTYKTTFQNFNGSAIIRTDFQKDFHINAPITTATLLQYDYRNRKYQEFDTYGLGLPSYPIYNFNQTQTQAVAYDYTEPFITYGYVVNQKIDVGEFGGVSGGFRSDYSSAYGQGSKPFTFPNVNAYIRLSSFDFWKNSSLGRRVSEFKLRAAYGKAGIQPQPFDRYPTLVPQNLGTNLAFALQNASKNPNLSVEISKETEFGTDFSVNGLTGNWLSLFNFSATYWRRKGTNVIYDVAVPPSTGAGTIKTNAIDLSSNGFQASLNINVLHSKDFNWSFTTNFSRQTSKIDAINGPSIILASAAGSTQLTLNAGTKIGQIYGYKALTSLTEVNQAGVRYIADADLGNYEIVNGRVVNKATKGVQFTNEAYSFGDPNPKFNMSFINSFSYKQLSLGFQFDWVHGSHLYNQTKEWMYRDGISSDYDIPVTIDGKTAAYTAYYRSIYADYFGARNGPARNGTKDYFYEDASFVRLRNVSLSWDFAGLIKNKVFRKVQLTFTGRNLLTFTKYTGFDPEISTGTSNSAFDRGVDNSSSPNLKSYQVGLNLGF